MGPGTVAPRKRSVGSTVVYARGAIEVATRPQATSLRRTKQVNVNPSAGVLSVDKRMGEVWGSTTR
jgi:hypothetical protein